MRQLQCSWIQTISAGTGEIEGARLKTVCASWLRSDGYVRYCGPKLVDSPDYVYKWLPGSLVNAELLEELAALYSSHYGVWGLEARNPFKPIRLSARRITPWLASNESRLAYACSMVGWSGTQLPSSRALVVWVLSRG